MKKQIVFLFVIAFSLQTGYAQYKLNCGAFGNGCVVSANLNHKIAGLAGQVFIGSTVNSQYGSHSGLWRPIEYITPIEDFGDLLSIPKKFELKQNYPNPFNPLTHISYAVPKKSHVRLEIYNILGQRINTLVDAEKKPGYYTVQFNGYSFSSGLYIYRLQADGFHEVKRMILIK